MFRRATVKGAAIGLLALMLLSAVLFISGYLLTVGDYQVAKTVSDNPSLPFIEIDGYRFHGETFGNPDSPTVIVVHGGPGWDYRSLLPLKALANDYFVVFFDQRGAGLSPRVSASQLSLETALHDLDAVVEHFRGQGTVSLIGHSWGGMLVSGYLGQAPEKVNHAVLMEPGFLNSEMFVQSGLHLGPRWEADYLVFAVRRWFESLHIQGPDPHAGRDYFLGEVAARANSEYYCAGEIPQVALEHWRAGAIAMSALFKKLQNADGGFELDLTEGLNRYKRQVLLVASECNTLIGVQQQRRHSDFFPNSRLEVIPDSGHMMVAENPEATLAVIRRYLKENRTAVR